MIFVESVTTKKEITYAQFIRRGFGTLDERKINHLFFNLHWAVDRRLPSDKPQNGDSHQNEFNIIGFGGGDNLRPKSRDISRLLDISQRYFEFICELVAERMDYNFPSLKGMISGSMDRDSIGFEFNYSSLLSFSLSESEVLISSLGDSGLIEISRGNVVRTTQYSRALDEVVKMEHPDVSFNYR